jgi:hypothetical protein
MGYRYRDQIPPEPRPRSSNMVERIPGHPEIDPDLMKLVGQQRMPVWDSERIAESRNAYTDWMRTSIADEIISGEELLEELSAESEKSSGGSS